MSICVAVRVRPFLDFEKAFDQPQICIQMQDQTTTLLNVKDPLKNQEFVFNHSLWSQTGFEKNKDGKNISVDPKHIGQEEMYNRLGSQMLDHAFQGYNCCILTTGASAVGKTYTMIGNSQNKGIVSLVSEDIFRRISASDPSIKYEVCFSVCQIYNEQVQDVLIPFKQQPKGGYKIRENKDNEYYVENLSKIKVNSQESLDKLIDKSFENRFFNPQQMNAASSIAHLIYTIEIIQRQQIEGRLIEKQSRITLVDLAPTLRLKTMGVTGKVAQEVAHMNQSNQTLIMVIKALADIQQGKKGIRVPYRDSLLTKILSHAFGGNCLTTLIFGISPNYQHYNETLSTLQLAEITKSIKNRPIVNQTLTEIHSEQIQQNESSSNQQPQCLKQIFS